tara:strand:- start:386 stop:583 length:198 start_codon:yes stop_codon:yes gene_type:complete
MTTVTTTRLDELKQELTDILADNFTDDIYEMLKDELPTLGATLAEAEELEKWFKDGEFCVVVKVI